MIGTERWRQVLDRQRQRGLRLGPLSLAEEAGAARHQET